ncbi:hypothetical protein ABPG75_006449 [Micractinium tetrahymenae]
MAEPELSHSIEEPPLAWSESPRGFRPGSLSSAAGLLARLSDAVSGGLAAAAGGAGASGEAASTDLELNAPLLPAGEEEEAQYLEHVMEPKQWPQLRGSSVSTRRITPGLLSHELAGAAAPLSPRAGTAGFFAAAGQAEAASAAAAGGAVAGLPPGAAGKAQAEAAPAAGAAGAQRSGRYVRAAVAGAVNAVIGLPLQLSFAAIIFRDPFFRPQLGSLVKLVFLSSAIHQLAFVALSTLPFAVGQVQDVGLIFLSAIASAVVQACTDAGWSPENTLATVLAAVTAATSIVGVLIIGTGTLKLAGLVQYVPLPVVGGYLCFVGYFCLAAGVSLASGVQVGGLASWAQLASKEALVKLAPALVLVALITLVLHRVKSPFALPALLVATPAAFYGLLWARGMSLDEAREAGWVSKPNPGDGDWKFWRAWELYGVHDWPPSNILWTALPSQLPKLLALYVIVAFGSSMDIAAIQADSAQDLDYDAELVTVGVSNLLTACGGVGFTGSYIFSQTLFSMRMGVDSPLMGIIVAAAELAIFMLPVNVMTFLPNFYFGGLTAWIGQDILKDWLFIAYKRISGVEYALLLATFALVMAFGLEAGIAGGILLAALHFAYSYSKATVTAFTVVPSRSGAVRTFDQRTVLDMFSGRIVAVSLSGYLFFGSSVDVVSKVVSIAASTLESQAHLEPAAAAAAVAEAQADAQQQGGSAQQQGQQGRQGGQQQQARRRPRLASLPSAATLTRTYNSVGPLLECKAGSGGDQPTKVAAALAESPRYLILDFRRVQGLDATAARSFVTLHNKLTRMGIQLVITHITARNANVRELLAAQGLILRQPPASGAGVPDWAADSASTCLWFPTMDAGAQHCEERFLAVAVAHGLCPPPAQRMSLAQVLRAHLELPRCILGSQAAPDYGAAAAALQRFTHRHELRPGDVLFSVGDASDDIYILESGTVACRINFVLSSVHSRAALPALPADTQPATGERTVHYGAGSLVGELDFFLQRPRSFAAEAETAGSAWRLTRPAFEAMAAQDPGSLVLLQQIVLRSTSLSAAHALEALDRVSHSS